MGENEACSPETESRVRSHWKKKKKIQTTSPQENKVAKDLEKGFAPCSLPEWGLQEFVPRSSSHCHPQSSVSMVCNLWSGSVDRKHSWHWEGIRCSGFPLQPPFPLMSKSWFEPLVFCMGIKTCFQGLWPQRMPSDVCWVLQTQVIQKFIYPASQIVLPLCPGSLSHWISLFSQLPKPRAWTSSLSHSPLNLTVNPLPHSL